ncbi:MAG TPA: hypothetical protein VHD83_04205 [Puia sp.]|nr:hypothetical protein [Puia sp.]
MIQKALLLQGKPFFLAFCQILRTESLPAERTSLNAHWMTDASGSLGAIYFFPSSVTLLAYPYGAGPIQRPSFRARRIPWSVFNPRRSFSTSGVAK